MAKQDVLAQVARFGAEQERVDALTNSDNPPKLQAAALMASAAENREVNMADLPEITKAYFQGNSPKSLPQQQAKFGAFVKAGMAGYATQTMDKVREIIRGTNDDKAAKRAKAGIFEKMTNAMRKALEAGGVPNDVILREVLFGADKDAKDVELEALKRAKQALEAAQNVSSANLAQQIAQIEAFMARREQEIAQGEGLPSETREAKPAPKPEAAPAPKPETAPIDVDNLADHLLSA